MTNSIIQKTWTNQKTISIETNYLLVKTKNIREDVEYRIKFDELGFDQVKKRVKSANIPFYGFLIFDLLYICLLISSVVEKETIANQLMWVGALVFFGILTVAAFYNRNTDMIYLTGGSKVLELMAAKPTREGASNFITKIHEAMRHYFKNKYSIFDAGTPYELKVSQLKWLQEIEAISEQEYEQLLRSNKQDRVIGF